MLPALPRSEQLCSLLFPNAASRTPPRAPSRAGRLTPRRARPQASPPSSRGSWLANLRKHSALASHHLLLPCSGGVRGRERERQMLAAGRSSLLVREELPLPWGQADPRIHCPGEAKLQGGLEEGRICLHIWHYGQETSPICLLNRDCPTRIKILPSGGHPGLSAEAGPGATGNRGVEPALWGGAGS